MSFYILIWIFDSFHYPTSSFLVINTQKKLYQISRPSLFFYFLTYLGSDGSSLEAHWMNIVEGNMIDWYKKS